MKFIAITTVKNEAAFLLEWLAHHRAVGFTDFLVFSNDCDDGTDTLLDHLSTQGWLHHIRNPGPFDNRGVQFTALNKAANHPVTQSADWILPLDIDEFVNIHAGDGTLPDLLAELPDATAIPLTWRLFGNAGVIRYGDELITQRFVKCAPRIMHWPWRAAMFKTLYKNDGIYAKPGVHRPRSPDKARLDEARWFDGSGRALPAEMSTGRVFSDYRHNTQGLVQLNHYPLGAMESYVLKSDRGRAVHSHDRLGLDYWVERNFNTDTDRSILHHAEKVAAWLDQMRADPRLVQLHTDAVSWRKNRFEQLLQLEPNRALFGRLLMTPPSRPLRTKDAGFLINHALADKGNVNN